MADKVDQIRRQMARTRDSLQHKLDVLEDRTLGAVQKTTDAVVDVAETVSETVTDAKEAVAETVKKTERFFDLGRHVNKHPWAVMGGAVAAGFAASVLLSRTGRTIEEAVETSLPRREEESYPLRQQTMEREEPPSWLGGLMQMFAPQLDELKNLAIAASVGVVRDMALQAVPPQFSQQLGEIFDSFTERLGAKPTAEAEQGGTPVSTAGETRPRWETERRSETPQPPKKKSHGNGRHSESASR